MQPHNRITSVALQCPEQPNNYEMSNALLIDKFDKSLNSVDLHRILPKTLLTL